MQDDRMAVAPAAMLGLVFAVLALAGCAGVAPPPPSAPPASAPATPANQRAAAPAALGVETQWLQSWFKGTPVLIEQNGNGAITVEVPLDFCFKPGRASVQPALNAVLDKVAESLRRVPASALVLVAAPGDGGSGRDVTLALERAAAMRERLRSRGVPSSRLAQPSAAAAGAVQLRIDAALP
jgi:outer membrane protein OmpA-like peptidoglycan-associated protein